MLQTLMSFLLLWLTVLLRNDTTVLGIKQTKLRLMMRWLNCHMSFQEFILQASLWTQNSTAVKGSWNGKESCFQINIHKVMSRQISGNLNLCYCCHNGHTCPHALLCWKCCLWSWDSSFCYVSCQLNLLPDPTNPMNTRVSTKEDAGKHGSKQRTARPLFSAAV